MNMKTPLILFSLIIALSATATDIVPNPASPGNIGQAGNGFPNVYATNLVGKHIGDGSMLTNLPTVIPVPNSAQNTNAAFYFGGNSNYLQVLIWNMSPQGASDLVLQEDNGGPTWNFLDVFQNNSAFVNSIAPDQAADVGLINTNNGMSRVWVENFSTGAPIILTTLGANGIDTNLTLWPGGGTAATSSNVFQGTIYANGGIVPTNIPASGGSTNILGTTASGAEVAIPWSGLPTGSGGGNVSTLSSNQVIGMAGAAVAGSNYTTQAGIAASNFLVGATAGAGSTNLTGVNSAGAQVIVPWSSLPAGGASILGTPGNSTTPVYLAASNGPVWVSASSVFDDYTVGGQSEVYGSTPHQNGGSTYTYVAPTGYTSGRNGFLRLVENVPGGITNWATMNYYSADYTLWQNCYCSADVLFSGANTNLFLQIGINNQAYASGGVFGSNLTSGVTWEFNASLSPNFIVRTGGASTTTWTNAAPVALNTWYRLSFWGSTNNMVFGINDVPVWTNSNSATLPGGIASENVQIISGNSVTNPIGGTANIVFIDKFSFITYQ